MELQKAFLATTETTNVSRLSRIEAHPEKRLAMGDRRDDDITVVLEADEAAVEEVIDGWRQEESVLAV